MVRVRVRLLGTVQVAAQSRSSSAGQFIKAGTAKQSCVLTVLAMAPGRPVPAETLIQRVWGGDPPRSARDVLYQHASRQRALGLPVRRSAAGYVPDLAPDQIDVHRSRSLAQAARQDLGAGREEAAADSYRQASLLWQDTPLSGIGGDWAAGVREALNGEYLTLLGELFEVEMRRGRHAEVLPELLAAFSANPMAEVLAGQVMIALARSGRTTEALQCFAQLRQRTRDQLGIEPGPRVSEVHVRIMRQDPSLLQTHESDGAGRAPTRWGPGRRMPRRRLLNRRGG